MSNWSFDANQVAPSFGSSKHPVGIFDFSISAIDWQPAKTEGNSFLALTLTSPAGSIVLRLNLWNTSEKAVEIAHKQLSAICHVTGIYRLTAGARELLNARLKAEVAPQVDKPDFVEVKRVMDLHGHEAGQQSNSAPQQSQGNQSGGGGNNVQSNANWNGPQAQPDNTMTQGPQGGGQPQNNPAPMEQGNGGWQQGNQSPAGQQGGGANQSPPWGNR